MQPDTTVNRTPRILLLAAMAFLITACGGGGGGGSSAPTTQGVGGGGVKGPLANAIVTAYAFDATAAGFQGAVIDTGTTDATAKITGLALALPLAPPYILEFTSDGSTTDITTGVAPVITTMRTVLTQALLDTNEDVYATPLTTMATDLAVANADSNTAPFTGDGDGTTTSAEFVAALPVAASQVASTLGFGIDSTIDIFDTPPLVDDTTDTNAEQTDVAAYRAAVEAVTAVVYEMDQQSSGTSPDSVLAELTSDLANDGVIDGVTEAGVSTVLVTATLEVLDQDPATLPIPNDPLNQTVGDVEAILDAETATTGTTTDTTGLGDGTISTVVEPAETNPDIDGDGTMNADDAFPTDATEDTDTDGDGMGNNADADDDNDGVIDTVDDFDLDATEHVDTDGDGTGNNADTDDDGDGVDDATDDFPLDPTKQNATDVDNDGWPTGQDPDDADALNPGVGTPFTDTDGDGLANSGGAANDDDDDNDGVLDINDCAPLDPTQNVDTDGDTICDVTDTDDDGDGTADIADAFPLDNTETTDTDGDGVGNNTDTDDDNDGRVDDEETNTGAFSAETDDVTDPLLRDTDGDGYFDDGDAFPIDGAEHVDTDNDGIGNTADDDDDGDTVLDDDEITAGTKPLVADTDGDGSDDGVDALPLDSTETIDTDSDGIGNNADTDDDGDGLSDADEATAGTDPLVTDSDMDGVDDGTEVAAGMNPLSDDSDSDTILDDVDNCPIVPNTDQADADMDGVGDLCGVDTDSDGISDSVDNCPTMANTNQADQDTDTIGDVCDADRDGDGTDNTSDAFPDDATEDTDSDGDGTGDNSDICPTDATNACLDMTGVQRLNLTATAVTVLAAGGCDGEVAVNDTQSAYITTTQTGTGLVTKSQWGDALTGTVDVTTGAYTLGGVTTVTNPFSGGDVDKDTIDIAGNALTGAGTLSVTANFNAVDDCRVDYDFTTAQVYRHTGSEDYNGVYGLELLEVGDAGVDDRGTFALQIEVSGSTMALHLPGGTPAGETITNTSFDPNTGFFSFDLNGIEDYEDGSGSEEWRDKMTGILINAPDAAGGVPSIVLVMDEYSTEYDAIGGEAGGGTPGFTDQGETSGYGKLLSSTGFTRSVHFRGADGNEYDGIIMGISHPPLKLVTATSELYVEVLDTDGVTRLCTGPYSARYTNTEYQPAADFGAEQFQSQWYSFATCNTSTILGGGASTHNVADTDNVTVRIMDTGADGIVDGTGDTVVTSMTFAAEVNSAFFTELPSANSFALNGAAASKTMKQGTQDGVIELFGFFDVNEDMDFTWTGLAGVASTDKYWLTVKEAKDDSGEVRFPLASPVGGAVTETVTIPAGTLDMWDGNVINIRVRQDGSTANHRALSVSKWGQMQPGIRGLFNVELGGDLGPFHDTFQLWLNGDMGDGMTGFVSDCQVTNNPSWTCNSGSIDYSTNTISLNMTDTTGTVSGAPITLDLEFGTGLNYSSASATVTSGDVSLTSTNNVRLVNPEFGVRSMKPSGPAAQQSLVTVGNTIGAGDTSMGGTFDKAVFKPNDSIINPTLVVGGVDSGATAKSFWSEASAGGTKTFDSVVTGFQMHPTDDGVAQRIGHYIFNRTNSDWGLGAGLLEAVKYKAVWTTSTDPNLKFVFKRTYAAPDASVLVTPLLGQVTVDLAAPVTGSQGAANGGDANNPVDITNDPAFPLTWTGSTVVDGEWQVRIIWVSSTGSGIPAGTEIRTDWMTDGVGGLTDVGGLGTTWSWVNGTGIGLTSGDVVKVQIRTRDADNTMIGVQRMGGAIGTEDAIYLTVP